MQLEVMCKWLRIGTWIHSCFVKRLAPVCIKLSCLFLVQSFISTTLGHTTILPFQSRFTQSSQITSSLTVEFATVCCAWGAGTTWITLLVCTRTMWLQIWAGGFRTRVLVILSLGRILCDNISCRCCKNLFCIRPNINYSHFGKELVLNSGYFSHD
jgi:hypothetical protein